jgi:hypothetical protein
VRFVDLVRRDDPALRLTSILGVGVLNAYALVAAVGNASGFDKARDLRARLGLGPRQHITGGKPRLLEISKRGNAYPRPRLPRRCVIASQLSGAEDYSVRQDDDHRLRRSPRRSDGYLQLDPGEAAVIRNVGGRVNPGLIETMTILAAVSRAAGQLTGDSWNLIVLQYTNCGIAYPA